MTSSIRDVATDTGDFDSEVVRSLPLTYLVTPWTRRLRWIMHSLVKGGVRRRLADFVLGWAHPASDHAPQSPVCVVGYFSSRCGMGEGARLTAASLAGLGCSIRIVDLAPMFGRSPVARGHSRPALEKGAGTIVYHFNPEALVLSLLVTGRARLQGKRIIGYWAWELQRVPPAWVRSVRFLDEIWVPSNFVAAAVRQITHKPVRVVPHPVATLPPGHSRRADFGIGEKEFTVLTMFSLSSSVERKNPFASIRAFFAAFGDDPRRQLILKVSDSNLHPMAASLLRDAISGMTNVRVLETSLTGQETRDLIASVDVVLSLHRAEGFGLVLAEAMHCGTAVVATDWSGNADFMDTTTACLVGHRMVPATDAQGVYRGMGEMWAEPSIPDATRHLQFLADNPDARMEMTARAQAHIRAKLGLSNFRNAMAAALAEGCLPPAP